MMTLLAIAFTAVAQNITVRGTVSDDAGIPVAGAYIVDENSKTGVNTDVDGRYELSVSAVSGRSPRRSAVR